MSLWVLWPILTRTAVVVKCVHGKHTECNPQYSSQAGNQETAGATGEGFGAEFEFSDRGCGGSLRLRSGEDAGRGPTGGSAGQVGTLHQERGYEGVAVVMGDRARVAGSEVRLRQGTR